MPEPAELKASAGTFWLADGPLPGDENMDRDLRLLERALAGEGPLLRTYAWARPTLSLGYFQRLEDVAEAAAAERLGVDVTRRFTGGGAILHHLEATFAVALPAGHAWARLDVDASYLAITRPLLELLRRAGVPAEFRGERTAALKTANCFAGRACPDLVVAGRKIFGSAQRRRHGAVLQHGSLLLAVETGLWEAVFGARVGEGYVGLTEACPGLRLDWPGSIAQAYGSAFQTAAGPAA